MTQASSNKDKKNTLQIPKKRKEWKNKLLSCQDKTIAKRQIWDKAKQAKPRRNKPGQKKWVNEVGNTLALLYAFVFLFFYLCLCLPLLFSFPWSHYLYLSSFCLGLGLGLGKWSLFLSLFSSCRRQTKDQRHQYQDQDKGHSMVFDIPQHNRVRRQCTP